MENDNKRVRFSGAKWLLNILPTVTVGGVGGIGSWLAFYLGRIGVPMFIYENDSIDETNMGGQLYDINSIGQRKDETVLKIVREFSGFSKIQLSGLFTENNFATPISFSCFDNMEARKLLFDKWKNLPNKELFIDGRMLAESFQVYCVTPDRIEAYEKTLFDDKEVAELMCSYKATSHCGAMISSNMVALFTNYLTNKNLGIDIRELPFSIFMEISLMKYETAYL